MPKGVPHRFELQSDKVKELMWVAPAGLDEWFWDNSMPGTEALPVMQGPPPPEMIAYFVRSLSAYGVEMV